MQVTTLQKRIGGEFGNNPGNLIPVLFEKRDELFSLPDLIDFQYAPMLAPIKVHHLDGIEVEPAPPDPNRLIFLPGPFGGRPKESMKCIRTRGGEQKVGWFHLGSVGLGDGFLDQGFSPAGFRQYLKVFDLSVFPEVLLCLPR